MNNSKGNRNASVLLSTDYLLLLIVVYIIPYNL